MAKWKIKFRGFAYVEADTQGEAEEMYEEGEVIYEEKEVHSEEVEEFKVEI